MLERLRESRGVYIFFSIFLALVFWLYVREVDDSTQRWTVYNVPVQLVGERMLEERGLTVSEISQDTVDVEVQAPISVRNSLNRSNITVSLDVSNCTAAGEYEILWVAKLPTNINTTGSYFPEQNQSLRVTIDTLVTETRPVEFQLEGSVADGYQAGTPEIQPETVELSGTQEQVEQVKRVVAVLSAENLDETYAGTLPLKLFDQNGAVITTQQPSLSVESVYVTLPVGVIKEVPLTVEFVAGGGATPEDVLSYKITPESITVVGSKEETDALTEISVGSIDLSTIVGSGKKSMPISLSPTLENVLGITEATVEVELKELPTRTFTVSNISLINQPAGYTVELMTQERLVVVRGDETELGQLDASKLRIVADLSNLNATGQSSVKVQVYLDASDAVGVVGEYTINVNVSK